MDWLPQANGPPRVLQSVHVNQSEYTQCQQGCGGRLLKPSLLPCPVFFRRAKKDIHYSILKSFKELLVGFVYFSQVMLLVIIPQIKQAISRAMATFATFDFFPF